MKKFCLALSIISGTFFLSCEKKPSEALDSNESGTSASTDTSSTEDKTDYGNGSTRTSGNSGH